MIALAQMSPEKRKHSGRPGYRRLIVLPVFALLALAVPTGQVFAAPPDPPTPTNPGQFKSDGAPIPAGGSTDESSVVMKGIVNDPDENMVELWIDFAEVGKTLSGSNIRKSPLVPSGTEARVTVSGLADGTSYHWRSRMQDSAVPPEGTDWENFNGGTTTGPADFTISLPPPPPSSPPPAIVPVQDFSVSCNPAALTAAPGGSAPSTCTVKSQEGFNQPVTLSCTGQPVGAACAFKPNPVTPPPNGSIDSALTVNVLGDAGTGDFKFQVVGTAGRVTRKAALGLAISLQPPPPPGPPIELPGPKGPEALELDRPSAEPGGDVNASGKGCDPNAPVELFMEGTQVGSGTADQAGDFDIPIKLPDSAGVGRHEVIAECGPTIETTVDVVVVARAESPGAPMGVLAVLIFFILEVRRLVRREGAVTPRR